MTGSDPLQPVVMSTHNLPEPPMIRWKVKLNDMSGDTLAEMLESIGFTLDGDLLFGPEFEALQTDQDVSKHARELMRQIKEISRLTEADNNFVVGPVHEFDSEGNQTAEHTVVHIQGRTSMSLGGFVAAIGHAGQLTAEGRAERERIAKVQRVQTLMRASWRSELVLTVLKLLDGDVTGTDLGHVHDFIQDNVGGALYPTFGTETEFTRFNRSINHPTVLGLEARHAVSNVDAPPNPMTKNEARDFMVRVSWAWIEDVARQDV